MNPIFERIPLYAQYFLYKVDQHSLQAPFAFNFYVNQIIQSKKDDSDEEIELKRKNFQNSSKSIQYHSFGQSSKLNSRKRKSISQIAKKGISDVKKSKLFSRIIRDFQFTNILELGTSLGVNTAYLSKASIESKIVTFEGHPELAEISQSLFKGLNLDNIHMIKGNIDREVHQVKAHFDSLDFVFIDANHCSKAVLNYYHIIKPLLKSSSIVVVDDIRWSKDMYEGWKKLRTENGISHSFDLGEMGILCHQEAKIRQDYMLNF